MITVSPVAGLPLIGSVITECIVNVLPSAGIGPVEFAMLVGTMLMIASGASGWAWFYAAYSGMNFASAWLILSGRI